MGSLLGALARGALATPLAAPPPAPLRWKTLLNLFLLSLFLAELTGQALTQPSGPNPPPQTNKETCLARLRGILHLGTQEYTSRFPSIESILFDADSGVYFSLSLDRVYFSMRSTAGIKSILLFFLETTFPLEVFFSPMQSRGSKHAKSILSTGGPWFDSYSNEENLPLEYTFFFVILQNGLTIPGDRVTKCHYTRDFPLPEKAILLDFPRYTSIKFDIRSWGY